MNTDKAARLTSLAADDPLAAIRARLDYLRSQIDAESISYYEISELQGLAEHIDPTDVVLLQWAGVPEFPEDRDYAVCPEAEDGKHDPVIAHFQDNRPTLTVECAACGTTTGVPFTMPDTLEWN